MIPKMDPKFDQPLGCQSNFEIDGDCRFLDDIYSLAPLLVGAVASCKRHRHAV